MYTVGNRFPDFTLQAVVSTSPGEEFAEITNDSHPGKWRVIFFWPMDFTFVCPTEIAEFGAKNAEFEKRDALLLGGSTDTHYVHLAWRNDHPALKDLPFPMLADTKRELSTALGILHEDGILPARHVHRGPRGGDPLRERQRSVGRPERRRGASSARCASDR